MDRNRILLIFGGAWLSAAVLAWAAVDAGRAWMAWLR